MWVIIKNKSKELNLAISELANIDLNKYYIAKTKINKKLKNVLLNYFFLEIEQNTNLLKEKKLNQTDQNLELQEL